MLTATTGGVLIGLALAALPILLAGWPRVAAAVPLLGDTYDPSQMPDGLTPFVAGFLNRTGMAHLMACGVMAVLSAPRLVSGRDAAATYLSDTLAGLVAHHPDSESQTWDARRQAAEHLVSPHTNWDPGLRSEVRHTMRGLGGIAGDDARNLGLTRDTSLLRRALLVLAGAEFLGVLAIDERKALQASAALLVATGLTAAAAVTMDARTPAGVRATRNVRRLARALRRTVVEAGSLDAASMRALMPAARSAQELEIWAIAAGCHTPAGEQTAARLWAVAAAGTSDSGHVPTQLMSHPGIHANYLDLSVTAYARLVGLLLAPFRWVARPIGRGRSRSPVSAVLW